MFIISDKTIKSLAANDPVYQRGLAYFRENRVEIFEFPEEDLCLSAGGRIGHGIDVQDVVRYNHGKTYRNMYIKECAKCQY